MNEPLRQPSQKPFSAAGLAALSELLFLLTFAAYLIHLALGTTTFDLDLPGKLNRVLLLALLVTGSLKLIFQLTAEGKENRKIHLRLIMLSLPVALLWMLVYRSDGYGFLRFLAVLTVAFVGTDYRKTLKVFVVSVGTVVLSAVLCSFTGSIQNLIYDDITHLRSAWGIVYPTDFSAYLVFLCLVAWVAWRDLPDLFFLLPGALSLVIARAITGSNTGVICSVLFLAAVILSAVLRDRECKILDKLIHLSSAVSFPLLGVMMIAMTWAYHEGSAFARKLDIWNHGRLSLASSVFDEAGLSLFGTPFKQSGAGKALFGNVNYHFVDCSYLLILLRYGVVTLLVLALLWVLMTVAAAKLRDRRLLLVFMVIAVHCMSEHHYTDLNYNPFLVLPFSLFLTASGPEAVQAPEKQDVRQSWIRTGILLLVSSVLALALIWVFPRFTTLCTFFDLGGSARHRRFLFAAAFAGLLLLFLFADACTRFLTAMREKREITKPPAVLTGVLVLFFLGGLLASNSLFDRAEREYHDMLASERPAVEAVHSAGCRLVVDNLPELYRRTFGFIDRSLFHGEDLARVRNLAVITDADRELNALISRGFLYAEISDHQAVYTDSAEAVKALQTAGYHLRGYYSRDRELDLGEISWAAYGEPLVDENTINLSARGPIENSVRNDLYAADYRITYDLQITTDEDNRPASEDPICTLRVTCYPEDTVCAERPVLFSEFDGDGRCSAELNFSAPNIYWAEFLIVPEQGDFTLHLQGIRYQKIPNLDTHVSYDSDLRKIREAFFDPESGEPITISDGSQVREYDYDKAGNTTLIRYLDADGNLVMSTAGYAELCRTFDEKMHIVREEYYDADSNPQSFSDGSQVIEYSYDEAGNATVIRYLDADGNLMMSTAGYAELHRSFDDKKRLIYEEYYDISGLPYRRAAGYSAIEQEYDDEGHLVTRRYLDSNGNPVQRTDGFSEAKWSKSEGSPAWNLELFTVSGDVLKLDGINLAKDIASDGWSAWMRPVYNTVNSLFNIGSVNLGEKMEGDTYTCQIEIEFHGVTATDGRDFMFRTQGAADGLWNIGNVWDSNLVRLETVPEDGIYCFTVSRTIDEAIADASTFNISFRCDNWASGAFRVRNVKIEKGTEATPWTPGI